MTSQFSNDFDEYNFGEANASIGAPLATL